MKVRIRGHRTQVLNRWRDHIYERLAKLERFEDRIIKVDYILSSSHHHLKGSELCRIRAKVPRKTIAVRKSSGTMIAAIDAASKVLEQQVHHLWNAVKVRNRHSLIAKRLRRVA